MCLIAFAWQAHPEYDLIVAANRDEFYQRPTQTAHWWPEDSAVYGGRDSRAGGAWCGADRRGRFAAVTNVREAAARTGLHSRGELVYNALTTTQSVTTYARGLTSRADAYGPFNLLLADRRQLLFQSNRGRQRQVVLKPGVYAISNAHWDEDWPKTVRACHLLTALIEHNKISQETVFELLGQGLATGLDEVSELAISPDTEQLLSALFVRGASYGTRASTLLLRSYAGSMDFYERAFDQHAAILHDQHEHWSLA